MMISGGLRTRRKTETVTIKNYAGATIAAGITASRTEAISKPIVTSNGVILIETVTFFFEATSGSLPNVQDEYIIVDATGKQYEVLATQNQAGEDEWLKAMTRRYA